MTEIILNILFSIANFINENYYYSFLIYLVLSICFFSLSLPGGMIISISSGFFFGFIEGFIINILSITTGSLIFIVFSKTLFSKLFKNYYDKFSDKMFNYIKKSSYEYLILIRLIIGPPLIFQNLCISLLDISKTKIFITSFIGFSPLMLLFSYIGSIALNLLDLKSYTVFDIFSLEVLFLIVILIILLLLKIYFKK